jgi:putative ABC transport system permease protein
MAALAVYGYASPVLTGEGEAEPLQAVEVTSAFFDVLGTSPLIGRTLRAEDDGPDATPAVVLSHGFWTRRFAADPSVVGRTIRLDGLAHVVVGVMPARFAFPNPLDAWSALRLDYSRLNRGSHYLFAIGRMADGVTVARAQADLSGIARTLSDAYPETNLQTDVRIVPLHDELVAEGKPALLALLAAVGLVLLIACTNVANLLVARASSRSGEVAVRRALGAGRRRLLWQFLLEGALLTAVGGAAGMILAMWGVDALVGLSGGRILGVEGIRVDGRVLAFATVLLATIAGVLGLAQAHVFSRADAAASLRGGERGGAARQRLRSTLAGAQLALALPLLVGAVLLLRTVDALRSVSPGFEPAGVITMRLELPESRYPEQERQAVFVERADERILAVPGVSAAGMTSDLPFSGSRSTSSFSIEGRPEPAMGRGPVGDVRNISVGYLEAMGIDVVRGRGFNRTDVAGAALVVIINETLARRYFPEEDAIGQRLELRRGFAEIVGIIEDVRHDDLRADAPAEFYLPIAQQPSRRLFIAARVDGPPAAFVQVVRQAVLAVDPEMPPFGVRTMEERLDRFLTPQRVTLRLLGVFAGVAILLAALGLYGVIAYAVSQRRRELGIRMALGADRGDIMRLVLGQGSAVIASGIAVGLVASWGMSRALASLLFGVGAADPVSFGAVSLLLTAVALMACWLPATRATRTEPVEALRHE